MIESISYDGMITNLRERYMGNEKTFGILLVKPYGSAVYKEILENLTYYHHRSGAHVDIFLPGYGAYWNDSIPDTKDICEIEGIKWSFSTKKFVEFIEDLSTHSKFKYSGEIELLLVDYKNRKIDYSQVVRIKLNKALRDGAIDSAEELIERVLGAFINQRSAYNVSDALTLHSLGKELGEELKQKFSVYRLFTRSRHFVISSLEK